jgi:plasmid stability protein
MSKMIQVRNVPDRLHRELVRRARARGVTLTDYLEDILEREVSRPPAEEVFERIARRTPVDLGRSVAEILREEREGRPAP